MDKSAYQNMAEGDVDYIESRVMDVRNASALLAIASSLLALVILSDPEKNLKPYVDAINTMTERGSNNGLLVDEFVTRARDSLAVVMSGCIDDAAANTQAQ